MRALQAARAAPAPAPAPTRLSGSPAGDVLACPTAGLDRVEKLPLYATAGVGHAWLVDPLARTLEVLRLDGGRWVLVGNHRDDARVRVEPFDAIEIELGVLWAR